MTRIIPKLTIVLGYTGTGKSTFVKEKIVQSKLKSGSRVLVITPHDIDQAWDDVPFIDLHNKELKSFKGIRRNIADSTVLEDINQNYRNGLIVFDDCRSYITANTLNDLHTLLISRKQRGLDICVVAHGFTEIPPKFYTFCSEFVLFQTRDSIKRIRNYLSKPELVENIQELVNFNAREDIHYKTIFKVV
jgi:hypothetical protein